MCESHAYLQKPDGSVELLLESVDVVEPHEGGLMLTTIFGEQRFVKGRILKMELVDHKILLEPTE